MDTLLGSLRRARDELSARGAQLAQKARERGASALETVRAGAIDWRRTIAAHRSRLGAPTPRLHFASLRVRVLEQVDRVLARFASQVRAELERLRRFELPEHAARPSAPAAETSHRPAPKKRTKAESRAASKRLVLPIADYEARTAKDILAELPRLSDSQCEVLRAHERAHKKRK
ncbi:MAG TPA: hypothetical protein VIL20_29440, partial [Sandaracinaceae bacterium]